MVKDFSVVDALSGVRYNFDLIISEHGKLLSIVPYEKIGEEQYTVMWDALSENVREKAIEEIAMHVDKEFVEGGMVD